MTREQYKDKKAKLPNHAERLVMRAVNRYIARFMNVNLRRAFNLWHEKAHAALAKEDYIDVCGHLDIQAN